MNESKHLDSAILAEKEILDKVRIAMRSNEGPKRWFWELLQNAIDTISELPDQKVNLKVIIEPQELEGRAIMRFSHDGEPFKESAYINRFDDFKNLILPMSGKRSSSTKTVGKFGTGFLSTHNLSLKVDVSGAFKRLSGEKLKIATTLDRTFFRDESDEYETDRIKSIIDGLEKRDASLNRREPVEDDITQFTYYLNDSASIDRVKTGLMDVEQSLPIVMALNSKIKTVRIENELDGESYTYEYGETKSFDDLKIQTCYRNENIYSVAYLSNENVTLCWPVENSSNGSLIMKDARYEYEKHVKDKMPVVYSTFPMIGSDGLKFPVTVNSRLFKPNQTRDGISLTDKIYTDDDTNEEIELDIVNKDLIKEAVKLYSRFIEIVAPTCDNLFYVSKVNGTVEKDWISKPWFIENVSSPLKKIIAKTPIIDINENRGDRKSILGVDGTIQVYFPQLITNSDIEDKRYRNRLNQILYIFSKQLFGDKIPLWKDLKQWHEVIWSDKEIIKVLEIEDIVKEIHDNYKSVSLLGEKLNKNEEQTLKWLNHLYDLIETLEEQKIYKDYEILPNQYGDFKLACDLNAEADDSMIESQIIDVLKKLNPDRDLYEVLLDRKIICSYSFHELSLKTHISSEINELLKDKDNSGYYTLLKNREKAVEIVQTLLSCKSVNSQENTNKEKIFKFSKDIFGSKDETVIPFFEHFQIENTIRHMIRLINLKITDTENVEGLSDLLNKDEPSTLEWLNDYLNFQAKNDDYKRIIVKYGNVIPNQKNVFKAHGTQEDKDKMYSPYSLVNDDKIDVLDSYIIKVLRDLSDDKADDWQEFLVHDEITITTLPVKRWQDLGHSIDIHVSAILVTIVEDKDEQKSRYLQPMLTLLEWCEGKNNRGKAEEFFKTTYANKDKLYLQLTYSPENVAILKDKSVLDLAKRIQGSNVDAVEFDETLEVLSEMKSKLGSGAISEFLKKASKYITTEEDFKHRLATGQNIEKLLQEALEEEGIDVDVDKSNKGAYDIEVTKRGDSTKVLQIEVKSYSHNSNYDFRFANSQVIEANSENSNYIVCTFERKQNDEECDIEYLRENLKVQLCFKQLTSEIYPTVLEFDRIYKMSKSNLISLEIPCIEEPRIKVDHQELLSDVGNYNKLIELIKQKIV